MIESLLNKPCWVIDFLPEQVPENSPGQYFAVEKYFLNSAMLTELHRRFATLLLKLNCYLDFLVSSPGGEEQTLNPNPESLIFRIVENQEALLILLPEEKTLLSLNHDDLYMTVYNPSETLISLINRLASSEGLFFRKPKV